MSWTSITWSGVCAVVLAGCVRTGLPGRSHRGPLASPGPDLLVRAGRIEEHVRVLAEEIGPRSAHRESHALHEASEYIEDVWRAQGFQVERQLVVQYGPTPTYNLIARVPGVDPPLVVGAHYDTVPGSPGAGDNASGVAALLELTRAFAPQSGAIRGRAVHFVAWTTEEPPFFTSPSMGSAVHAASLSEVHAAISLDSVGTFSDEPGSQRRPFPLSLVVRSRGDFIAFVSNPRSHRFVREVGGRFREAEPFPTVGGTAPPFIPGIGWSDHRNYWNDAPSLLVTDTAAFRAPHYHEPTDTPTTIDPVSAARISRGLEIVLEQLVSEVEAPAPVVPTLADVRVDTRSGVIDATRGGRLTVTGSGFDAATTVRLDAPTFQQTLPVFQRDGATRMRVVVEDVAPGTYGIEIANDAGQVRVADAVTVSTDGVPPTLECEDVVYFASDSAVLTSVAGRTVESLRFCLLGADRIQVTGYADPVGESAYNDTLGRQRAEAVAALLVSFGLPEARIEVGSRGEDPSDVDRSAEERRRVEIRAER